ncbi:MAG: VOC family protein [Pseudomonadota bacterium]
MINAVNPSQRDLTFHHAAISVPDLKTAVAWYGKTLGFQVERRFEIPAAGAEVAMLRRGNLRIEVFCLSDAAPLPADRRSVREDLKTHGNKHVAFAAPDLDGLREDLSAHGVDICFELPGDPRGFFVRDCAGNLIEFLEDSTP